MAYDYSDGPAQISKGMDRALDLVDLVTPDGGTQAPEDLTGKVVTVYLKRMPGDDDADALFTYSSPSNGVTITDAANGKATVTIPAADTATLFPGTYYLKDVVSGAAFANPDAFSTAPVTVYG